MTDKPDSLADMMMGKKPEKAPPIIVDRSRLEQTANCPLQAHLVAKHGSEILTRLVQTAQIDHALIDEAIKYAVEIGTTDALADYFEEELPKVRPDVQPEAIKSARHVCEKLLYMPIDRLIGSEMQIDYVLIKNKKGDVVITTCLDVLLSGKDNSLIVDDWKTGYKRLSKEEAFDSFQAQFICFILWQQPEYANVDIIHFWFEETRWGNSVYVCFDRNKVHKTMPHLTQELAFQARIFEATKLMLSGCQDAWPEEKKCLWCSVIKHCKFATQDAVEIAVDPCKAVDHFEYLKALCKKYKDGFTELIKGGMMTEIAGSVVTLHKKTPVDKFNLGSKKNKPAKEMINNDGDKYAVGETERDKPENQPKTTKPRKKGKSLL